MLFNACFNRFVDTKNATRKGCIFSVVRLRFSERFVLYESLIFGRFVSDLVENWICGLYISVLIHSLVYKEELLPLEKLIGIGRRYDERIEPYLKLAQADTLKGLGLDDEASMGYTLKAMAAGLWCVYHARSFKEGLLAIVNEGSDADTNGAVVGSLLGAKYGYESIPSKYIAELNGKEILGQLIMNIKKQGLLGMI